MSEIGDHIPPPLPDDAMRRSLYLYLLPIVLCPVLIILAAFFIVPGRWFATHTNSSYLANLAYARTLHNNSCQILIFGDSTAMVGVSPAILTARTGLTACNIAEFEGITLASGTLLVDRFLQHNPRPQYLVFLYAPEDLNLPRQWRAVSTFEAVDDLLRNEHTAATFKTLTSHPAQMFEWAGQGMRLALINLRAPAMAQPLQTIRARNGGQFPIQTEKTIPCDGIRRDIPPQATWLAQLRQKYGVDGTTVLIDATPTIPCDPSLPFFQLSFQGLIDNQPYAPLTADSYTTDGRLHANLLGTRRISNMIANQIQARRGVR